MSCETRQNKRIRDAHTFRTKDDVQLSDFCFLKEQEKDSGAPQSSYRPTAFWLIFTGRETLDDEESHHTKLAHSRHFLHSAPSYGRYPKVIFDEKSQRLSCSMIA